MYFAVLVEWLILAQNGDPGENVGRPNFFIQALPWIAIGLLFYMMLIKPERRKQDAAKQMLANLKKNDRVITVGGIKGIVANVHREADEVTINVDESTGTKLRVTIASIARTDGGDPKGESNQK